MPESVCASLAGLHAERVRTMAPEALAININQRRHLVETADRAAFVKQGDRVAPFTLDAAGGGVVSLEETLRHGPAVLVFFRFAGCPACNIALPYYQRTLYPGLRALGATLIAISPQIPERLVDIRDRHGLAFPIASDRDNALGRRFGIVFTADAPSQKAMLDKGVSLGDVTGTGTWDLPMPAVIVIAPDYRVHFADISPDWLVRTEVDPVLEAVRGIALQAAA
jgi:peroxiredoxin